MIRRSQGRGWTPPLKGAAWLLFALTSLPATAFDLDSKEPIRVESKSARLDDQAGTATYTGNVKVTQGQAQLKADRVILVREDGTLNRLEATGTPATYEQPETAQAPALRAEGNLIEYSAAEDRITVLENALIRQGGDRFRGNQIQYDLEQRVVTATSSESDDADRVEMTIQPGRTRDTGGNEQGAD